jgi:hypothetical protein
MLAEGRLGQGAPYSSCRTFAQPTLLARSLDLFTNLIRRGG